MTEPRPLDDFREALIKDKEMLKNLDGEESDDPTDLGHGGSSYEEKSIEALGAYDDTFEIVINRFGPVFFVSTNELTTMKSASIATQFY